MASGRQREDSARVDAHSAHGEWRPFPRALQRRKVRPARPPHRRHDGPLLDGKLPSHETRRRRTLLSRPARTRREGLCGGDGDVDEDEARVRQRPLPFGRRQVYLPLERHHVVARRPPSLLRGLGAAHYLRLPLQRYHWRGQYAFWTDEILFHHVRINILTTV